MRYYLTPVRMAKINKTTEHKYWQGHRERGTFTHCWWESKLVQQLWKSVWRILKEEIRRERGKGVKGGVREGKRKKEKN